MRTLSSSLPVACGTIYQSHFRERNAHFDSSRRGKKMPNSSGDTNEGMRHNEEEGGYLTPHLSYEKDRGSRRWANILPVTYL